MSHTLHRFGPDESLKKDIVFLMLPAKKINDKDNAKMGRTLREFMELGVADGCISIGNASTGNIYTLGGINSVLDSTIEGATVHCVFDDEEKAIKMLKDIKERDFGVSVVVTGLFTMLGECCKKSGVKPHTVEYSLGVWGNVKDMPTLEVREINAMCGHGMVAVARIEEVIGKIKAGRMTTEQGGTELAKTCTCGIFNSKRATEILNRIITMG